MTSMLNLRTYNPVIFQKIRVTTDLYGVKCKIFVPTLIPDGFMNYSEIEYSDEPFSEEKLLIPKAVIRRSNNQFNEIEFAESEFELWTLKHIPRYSKLLITETTALLSFIISEIQVTKDSRSDNSYYKYTLVPSSSVVNIDDEVDSAIEAEAVVEEDENFTPSIEAINKQPQLPPSSIIKVGKL